jgi:glycolate oxidase FAD binding subunit
MTGALSAREGTAADAVAGVVPRVVHTPSTRTECAEIFRATSAQGVAIAPMGGATERDLGAPPRRLDAVVSSLGLNRILEYAPPDQVVQVEAGVTLAALQDALAKEGQRLAIDPPDAARTTIGGLLATNAFGPLRTRYGSLRDVLIGISIVRADGSVARGGGKVVKNVAGFDLPKLMVGALGTLGMIEAATFRLHPVPETQTTMRARGLTAAQVRAIVAEMRERRLEPAAVVALGEGGAWDLFVRFEGFAAGVRQQRDRFAEAAGEVPCAADELSADDARLHRVRHDASRTSGSTCFKISALPAAFAWLAAEVLPPLEGVLEGASGVFYPTLGLGFLTGDAGDAGDAAITATIARARAALAPSRGSLVVQRCPLAMHATLDVWGPPPPAFPLMKRLKERFDPGGRLNPGRFVGGL